MPPVGTLLTEPPYNPVISDGIAGLKGVAYFRVNTDKEGIALNASGVPKKYSSWPVDDRFPSLICVNRTSEYTHGTDSAVTQTDGYSRVRCEYDSAASTYPLPIVGASYTRFASRISSQNLIHDVRFGTDPTYNYQIENGRGIQREVGGTVAQVIYFPPPSRVTQVLNQIISLQTYQAVNGSSVTLPPLVGTQYRYTIDARGARYNDYEIGYEAGLLRITHSLIISQFAGVYRWFLLSPSGTRLPGPVDTKIYNDDTFTNLW